MTIGGADLEMHMNVSMRGKKKVNIPEVITRRNKSGRCSSVEVKLCSGIMPLPLSQVHVVLLEIVTAQLKLNLAPV